MRVSIVLSNKIVSNVEQQLTFVHNVQLDILCPLLETALIVLNKQTVLVVLARMYAEPVQVHILYQEETVSFAQLHKIVKLVQQKMFAAPAYRPTLCLIQYVTYVLFLTVKLVQIRITAKFAKQVLLKSLLLQEMVAVLIIASLM